MDSMFLTENELAELTGKRRHNAQVKVLRGMGVEHKIRPDGSIVVLRAHAERILGERAPKSKIKAWEPAFH
ncbi:protein of unknown function [Paraburkholderia phenazinium]|uniref:DUF4224 domain-containing protein n=1 Tax=Paraburkholderia phenazinium TaxID=60549 RepID=A0A1G7ZSR9_9BURK|nr:DUF4224 domain-containing protein [Paraburkholderia phenazinium]SDH11724.1 protein of unknown function [Paraburkholderia phenazinium]